MSSITVMMGWGYDGMGHGTGDGIEHLEELGAFLLLRDIGDKVTCQGPIGTWLSKELGSILPLGIGSNFCPFNSPSGWPVPRVQGASYVVDFVYYWVRNGVIKLLGGRDFGLGSP